MYKSAARHAGVKPKVSVVLLTTMDRPDVLAKFTTTVIADKAENRFLFKVTVTVLMKAGRKWSSLGEMARPHPKPAYLLFFRSR
ncbi:hypothetical protein OH492_25580 [Vibrio chagasii]|nr:hypothetical protein [Vibrio chagasii]